MTITVLDSADLVEAVTTGVVPVPKGIAEDNASQLAKKEGKDGKSSADTKGDLKTPVSEGSGSTEKVVEGERTAAEADDVEGEDGLTPRQKRDFTKAMQATIGKKHRMQKEAEELATSQYNQRQLAERRAQALEAELASIREASKPAEKVEEFKEPARDAFKTDQEYWDAMVDYRVDKKLRIANAEAAQRQEERQQEETKQHAIAKIERARELVPDFNEVTAAVDAPVPDAVKGYMIDSDMFAEIGYHFAKNPEVLEKLSKITDGVRPGTREYVKAVTKQLVELGKIESTLKPFSKEKADVKVDDGAKPSQSNGTKAEPETGSAPSKPRVQAPIIKPLNGGSASQVEKDEKDMGTSEVIQAWQQKHRSALNVRKRH